MKNWPGKSDVVAQCARRAGAKLIVVKLTDLQANEGTRVGTKRLVPFDPNGGDVMLTATIDPGVDANYLPADFPSWSGGEEADDRLQRKVPKDVPAETEVRCTLGDSNYVEIVKVVKLAGLEVDGASGSPNSPGVYVACCAPDTYATITATLNPSCTQDEAQAVLEWQGGEAVADDCTKRRVSLGSPGRHTVTAIVGDVRASVTILVVKVNWIKIQDQHYLQLVRQNPPDANDLYVPEVDTFFGPGGAVNWSVSVDPQDANGAAIVAKIDGETALPSGGSLPGGLSQGPAYLIPTSGNRTYVFTAGVDTNGDGNADCGNLSLTVHVVKVDLDVDTDNDGMLGDADPDEDAIEDYPPG